MSEKIYSNMTNCGPISVYVEDGKVTRVRPLQVDEKDFSTWKIEAGGKVYNSPKKFTLSPFVFGERQRLYSEERIKYPLKRVDFDPNGERNPENRGKSDYERISWDEALDIISGEITRIKDNYGSSAITGMTSSHHNWGIVGYKMGPFARFMNMLGYTPVLDNPDSWEGWHSGATHTYGFYWRLGMPEPFDMLSDALQNTEMIVYWSNDPDTTRGTYAGQESAIWRQWLKEKGVKMVFIDPFYNFTAAAMDGKWIPIRMGSGTAMAMAIAHVWITEDTYDKEYVKNRTIGFEEFKKHVLGEDDGQPKTPEWAEAECDVPARTLRAFTREWASKRTILSGGARGGEGSACREAYGTEWARMMVLLPAMQGLGKPGVNIWGTAMGAPYNADVWFPGYADPESSMARSKVADKLFTTPTKQRLYRLTLPDAILNPPVSWTGDGVCGGSLEQQFTEHTYPMKGYSEVKMFYRYGGSFIGTMLDTNKWVRMYQSPKLEFVVNQDCWYQSETRFADIILPVCTSLERDDLGEFGGIGGYTTHGGCGANNRVVVRQQKCIDPLWESKSDYEIFSLLSERLGLKEEYTEGKTAKDWARKLFEISDLPKFITWEEFDKKGYFLVPIPDDYKPTPTLRWYYEGRDCDTQDLYNPKRNTDKAKELGTYSGKIEFESESLKAHFPDDEERPVIPQYIPSWEGHRSELAKRLPLQLVSPHPRFSFHTHYDKHTAWLNEINVHRVIKDDYAYWPARINPKDAALRGIKDGDIVKLYNDRGTVLCIAQITERVKPGIIHSYASSAKYDPLEPGKPGTPDRGGCINLLTSGRMMSKHVPGMTPNSCLIDIAKWEAY